MDWNAGVSEAASGAGVDAPILRAGHQLLLKAVACILAAFLLFMAGAKFADPQLELRVVSGPVYYGAALAEAFIGLWLLTPSRKWAGLTCTTYFCLILAASPFLPPGDCGCMGRVLQMERGLRIVLAGLGASLGLWLFLESQRQQLRRVQ